MPPANPATLQVQGRRELDPEVKHRLLEVCRTLETANGQAFPIDFHQLAHDIREALK